MYPLKRRIKLSKTGLEAGRELELTPQRITNICLAVEEELRKIQRNDISAPCIPAIKLFAEFSAWRAGLQRVPPDSWKYIVEEIDRKEDPEYQEYLRLKKKFDK
jgi:hypothetical protein